MKTRLGILMKYPLGSAAVVAFLVVLLMMGWRRVTEPRVMGKGIREWVQDLPYDDAEKAPAREAIRSMDIEAIPYLLEVIAGPTRTKIWMFGKAAPLLDAAGLSLEREMRVSGAAIWELTMMAQEERLRNELQQNAEHPIREAIWPELLEMLDEQPQNFSRVMPLLKEMGPLKPGAVAAVRKWWARYKVGQSDYSLSYAAMLMAAEGDPAFLSDLIPATAATNSMYVRTTAIHAIGELGHRNDEVERVVSAAINDPFSEIRLAGLRASALLGFTPAEAKALLSIDLPELLRKGSVDHVLLRRVSFDQVCIIHRWLMDPKSETATKEIRMQLSSRTLPSERLMMVKLLGRAGPKAKQFVPELVEMLNHSARVHLQGEIIKALQQIDPERAEQERQRLSAKEAPGAVTVAE